MAKKEVQDIIRFLDDKDYKDIAIALMAIEHNKEQLPLESEIYAKYKQVYEYYFDKRDDLTGMLNEVLQNPNVIFQLSVKDSKPIATYDLNMFARLIIEKLNEADSK